MTFMDDINNLIDQKVRAALAPQRWVGTVTSDNEGYQQGVTTTASVVLDGSSAEITVIRPRHIRAQYGARVVVESVQGQYFLVAEFGPGQMTGIQTAALIGDVNIVPGAYDGQLVSITGDKSIYRYNAAGDTYERVIGTYQPMSWDEETGTVAGFNHTSYSTAAPICGVSFIAPVTGRGTVNVGALFETNTASELVSVSSYLKTGNVIGSGSDVYTPSDFYCIRGGVTASQDFAGGISRPITGLTPGAEYNVYVAYKISGGNGDMFCRTLQWLPQN